jgi:hypothetical protein
LPRLNAKGVQARNDKKPEIATPAFGGLAMTEGVLARLPFGKPGKLF